MNIVALAGGVGGAKLAHGLAQSVNPAELTVVVNTGDDFEHLGLAISPDLDTVMYTLAGLANPTTGWGQREETWTFLNALEKLGGETWFRVGDRDLATHVLRTRLLWSGKRLTDVTTTLCAALGVGPQVLPMTDDLVQTVVRTDTGELEFQKYFVQRHCEPLVQGFYFDGLDAAFPSPEVEEALDRADLVVLCPSNPFVSLDPILGLRGVRERVLRAPGGAYAVSPIVGGQALKGPAAKMLHELGREVSALGVAQHYQGLLRGFVLDQVDVALAPTIEALGLRVLVTDTVMHSEADRARLAREVLAFAQASPVVR